MSPPPPPEYSQQQPMTSVFVPSAPGYAPAGYPAAYAPPMMVPAPEAFAAAPVPIASRVGSGFLSVLIGLLLSAGGMYLVVKYGFSAAAQLQQGNNDLKDSLLTTVGAVLLLAAVLANGWSPWATVIPGIGLSGIGGWALFSVSGLRTVSGWTTSVLSHDQLKAWHILGFTMLLGLVMLAASIACALARASGKRDGLILGQRGITR